MIRVRHIYSSIDIGSESIKIIVCEFYKNKLNLLATTKTPSIGIKRGAIVDVEAVKGSIKRALEEIENMVGFPIRKLAVTVPSYQASFSVVTGTSKIDNERGVITGSEIKRALEDSIKNVPVNMKVVEVLPIDFKVDDKNDVKDPKGLLAENLESRAVLVTVPSKNFYSVVNLLESLGIESVDVSLNAISDMAIFQNEQLSTKISAIINLGYQTTSVSIYNKGVLVRNSILPVGSENIDNDLAYIYKISKKTAKKIKEKFALAHKRKASINDSYEVTNKIYQFEASEIVMARIEEILSDARKELGNLTSRNIDYIIITGGTSSMADFKYIAGDVFGKKVVLGNVKMLGIRNNMYSSALGSVIHFIHKLKLYGTEYTMINEEDEREFNEKGVLISNDSMLGKVFGYFFNE